MQFVVQSNMMCLVADRMEYQTCLWEAKLHSLFTAGKKTATPNCDVKGLPGWGTVCGMWQLYYVWPHWPNFKFLKTALASFKLFLT